MDEHEHTSIPLREHIDKLGAAYDRRLESIEGRVNDNRAIITEISSRTSSANAELKSFKDQMAASLVAQKEAVAAAIAAADRAVNKAELASEKRFEGVNEFRKSLDDYQRLLMPRAEAEKENKAISDRITEVNKALVDKVDIAIAGLTIKITDIQKELVESRGSKTGMKDGWALAIGAIGLLLTLMFIANMILTAIKQ